MMSRHEPRRRRVAWHAPSRPRRRRAAPAAALVLLATLAVAGAGCRERPAESAAATEAPKLPAPPVVVDAGGPYLLRYFSPTSGELVVVRKVDEVPEPARGQVLVVPEDPALQGPWLFVADLTRREGDRYPVTTVDRFALEAEVSRERKAAAAAAGASGGGTGAGAGQAAGQGGASPALAGSAAEVVLYKTAWCGYCKKAATYLQLKGVPFVTRDLERDPGAREDMLARARAAGFPPSRLGGVPVIWIKGKILTGFSREAIDAALGG